MPCKSFDSEYIKQIIPDGESSSLEFKEDSVHNERLAMEIAAFSNFKGGTILLGVSDDGNIAGLTRNDNEERIMNICSDLIEPRIIPEYEHLTIDGKKIAVIIIDPGKEKPYAVIRHGKRNYYIRVGSTVRESTRRELLRIFQDSAMLHVEALPTASDFRELDRGLVTDYFFKYRNISLDNFEETEFKRILINSSIMNENEHLTIAGCLLFGKHPARFYAGAGISFCAIDGNDISDPLIEVMQCDSNIFDNLERIFMIFRSHNRSNINGFSENGERLEDYEYPPNVFREIIVNAIIHRDYAIEGSQIRVFMFRDFLEVRSPGMIPNFLTVEKMKMGVTFYRNPLIMSYFYDKGLIERLGRGIRMIFSQMYSHNRTEPEITEQGGEVVVRIKRKAVTSSE